MRTPIFDHATFEALCWIGTYHTIPADTLLDLRVDAFGSMHNNITAGESDDARNRARTVFRISRELERRELAAEQASLQPKWIEREFDNAYAHRMDKNWPPDCA